ncbi:MAG: hypothetical protein AB7Q81_10040 [Gammaproteobacteria bacterium]
MKQIAAIAVAAVVAWSPAQAAGFQPWAGRTANERADAVQAGVVTRPYYRPARPTVEDARQSPQAEVVIKPWYTGDRV